MPDRKKGRLSEMGSSGSRLARLALAIGVIWCLTASAAQATMRVYQFSDATIAKQAYVPTGVAVDQETGDLYVGGNFLQARAHRFDAVTQKEDVFGEGNYESIAIDPNTHNIYALTRQPSPIRVESYNQEFETAHKPIPTAAGRGVIGADSAGNVFISDVGPINEQQRYTVSGTGGT